MYFFGKGESFQNFQNCERYLQNLKLEYILFSKSILILTSMAYFSSTFPQFTFFQ